MKKNVFIIGLGRFGQRLALILREDGYDVTVCDVEENIVKTFASSNNFGSEIVLNSTNLEVLKSTSVTMADHVVVAISKIEDSILTCVNLKDLGIKNITAKAQNKTHMRVLKSIGINDIIFPEEEAAKTTAQKITNTDIDIIRKGNNSTILKLRITSDKINGQTTNELNTDDFYIFAALKNEANSTLQYNPDGLQLKKMDTIFAIVNNEKIKWVKKTFIDESKRKFDFLLNQTVIQYDSSNSGDASKRKYTTKDWMNNIKKNKEKSKKGK